MIDARLKLSVLAFTSPATYTDNSEAALDYGRDTFSVTTLTTGYIYLGYDKPFNAAYAEITTVNTAAGTMSFQYYNGSTWVSLTTARDLTKSFTRSGWIDWTKPTDWATTTVNSVSKYWVRFAPSVSHSATTVAGINIVFADDYDMQLEFPSILATAFIPSGETSHIKTHVAARNQLTQDLRDKGYLKVDIDGDKLNLTPWDLHDLEEVRQAATYLALSKVFFNYSDDPTDHWSAKSKYYEGKYSAALDKLKVSYDRDDDGVDEASEHAVSRTVRMSR